MIEIRGFKWPHRSTAIAKGHLLGEDAFGRWLGIAQGEPWWTVDQGRSGIFESSFVKLVPSDTFWTACFRPTDPLIDVDIVLPVRWADDVLEEVDLELDVLRFADGSVQVRDQEEFDRVRLEHTMPDDIAMRAWETCRDLRALVESRTEPFGTVGNEWLTRFLAMASAL